MDGTHLLPRKNCQQDSSLTGQQFKIEMGIVQGIEVLQQNVCIPNNNITGAGGMLLYAPFTTFWMRGWSARTGTPGTSMKLCMKGIPSSSDHTKPPTISIQGEKLNHNIYRSNRMDFLCTTKLSPSTQCAVVLLFGSLSPGITNEGCSRC